MIERLILAALVANLVIFGVKAVRKWRDDRMWNDAHAAILGLKRRRWESNSSLRRRMKAVIEAPLGRRGVPAWLAGVDCTSDAQGGKR